MVALRLPATERAPSFGAAVPAPPPAAEVGLSTPETGALRSASLLLRLCVQEERAGERAMARDQSETTAV
eukprot:6852007-Alexandrium_andersonii.AAC.1